MNCLKCGKETQEDVVFCEECLHSMDAYPVKPGTVIHLPKRDTVGYTRKSASSKRTITAEDQVAYLKRTVRRMAFMLLVAVAALGVAVARLLHIL